MFHPLPLSAVQPQGWLQQQLQDDLTHGYAGRLDDLTPRAASDLFTQRIASSQSQLAWWDSETRGNWLWGYVMMAFLARDAQHMARVETLLQDLLNTQEANGYIGIYSPEWRYQHPAGENGELWGQSRALLPLLAYYEFTHKPEVLAAIERAVQLTMSHYHANHRHFQQHDDPYLLITGTTHGLCYVDVVAWLHRLTGNSAYRDFGVWLYDDFAAMKPPYANDDLNPANLNEAQRPFSGHAVHTVEHLRVLLWAAYVTQRPDLQTALQQALRKLRYYLLPSGAVIGDESIHGLPVPDVGYEYCTLTELLLSLQVGLSESGEGWFSDALERLAFNAAQGARMADGKGIAYLSTDTRLSATAQRPDSYSFLHDAGGRFKFSPTHEDIACCCNPNSMRLLPHTINALWMQTTHETGLAATLYGPCHLETTLDGVTVRIDEQTAYPFNHSITLTLQPERALAFALYLHQPAWSNGLIIEADGASITPQGDFVRVFKTWQAGDTIHITLKPTIRTQAYPTGEHSVHYGPLQFVLPIDHTLHPIKSYPVADFHDYDVLPVNLDAAYQPVFLEASQPDFGFTVKHHPTVDLTRPWHQTPITLQQGTIALVPMGCALLRRASFPMKSTPPTE